MNESAYIKQLESENKILRAQLCSLENHSAGSLQKAEDKLDTFLQTSLDGVWFVDAQSKINVVNDIYLAMSGYTREEFQNFSIADVEAKESTTDIGQHIDKIIKEGSDRFETKHRRKDGSLFDVEISVSCVDLDGEGLLCFLRDITEQKRHDFLITSRLQLSELSYQESLDAVIQSALDSAEAITNSTIGFFHFVDSDQEHLTLQAWSTNTLKNMCKAEGKGQHYPLRHAGVWVDCVKNRCPIIHNDYAALDHKKGLPPGHAPILRELTLPIIRNELVVAVIGVGNKPTPYTDIDIESVTMLANMVIDIVGRKRAEEALKGINEKLEERVQQRTSELKSLSEFNELVIDASPIGKYIYDAVSGQCVLVNAAAVSLVAAPNKEALLQQNFHQTESWKESGLYDLAIKTIETKKESQKEIIHKATFGKTCWATVRLSYFLWNGKAHLLLCVEDIAKRKTAEAVVLESEEKFRLLFENITEGVALHEVIYNEAGIPIDYKIIDVNPAYEEHTGLGVSVVGKLSTEIYNTNIPPYLTEFSKVAETRVPYQFETYFPPMKKHFIISVISPKQGQFATVFEDVTAQKQNELELRQKNDELTRFIYTVSHDLKSPLVTIKSFTSYLREDIASNDTEAQERDIRYIQNASDKMGKLLDELLELSRVGRKECVKKQISLQQIAQAAVDLVAGRINERKVEVKITAQKVNLFIDDQRLVQLFQNLIDNAVKFMGTQTNPVVEIGVQMPQDSSVEPVLFVRDNGIGIDERYMHKLFGLFEKLDPSVEGTGIGLALVKRIVEVHNGQIWVESKGLNQGTTFYFTLENTKILK